jgi:dihydrofolate reductase
VRKLVYYVAVTLDGFVAGPDDGIDFFPFEADLAELISAEYPETLPTHVRGPLGIADAPNRRFDTIVMGRRTYEPALTAGITSPYAHLRQYVVSRTLPPSPDPGVEVVPDDPVGLVRRLKAEDGGLDVWLCGGGDLAGQLLAEVDELVVKLSPVLAGAGRPVNPREFAPVRWTLESAGPLPSGVVVLRYRR